MIYYKRKSFWKKLYLKFKQENLFSFGFVLNFCKIFITFFIILIIALYSTYLFYLPKYITDEKVESCINNFLKNNSKLSLDVDNLVVSPNYKFNIKLKANRVLLNYSNGKNFITVENPDIELSLITLLFKYIDLNKIKAKNIVINTNFTKQKRYECFDYFNLDILELKNDKFTLRNIKILSDELFFKLYDENIKRNFNIKANDIAFISSGDKKPVFIQAKGNISGSDKISDFKLNLEIDYQKNLFEKIKAKIQNLNYNPFIYASKLKFYTNADVNLKFKNSSASGYINLSKLKFVVDNIQIPHNNLSLIFINQKIQAQGDFNFIKEQFIKLNLIADYSKNKFVELKLNSSEIDIKDLKKIIGALCKIFNIKQNFDTLDAQGAINADIYLKSNFKTIVSKGKINVQNTNIKDRTTGLVLNNINSDINFNNNNINIQNATAFVDNSRFHIEGNIDNKTNLNIKIVSDEINIAQIMQSAKQIPLISYFIPKLDEFIFKSGFIKINANIKGNLSNPTIITNSLATEIKLYIKSFNSLINSKEISISANPENFVLNKILLTAKNNIIECGKHKISNNLANLEINNQDIIIDNTQVEYNKIKSDVNGAIKNYKSNPTLEIFAHAKLPKDNGFIVIKDKAPNLVSDFSLEKNKLHIKNARIFEGNKDYMVISGDIDNFSSTNPAFENLQIALLERISCTLQAFDNLQSEATADVILEGTLLKPVMTGSAKLYNVICKKYDLFIKNCSLNIKNSNLNGFADSIDILQATLNKVDFKGLLDGDILKILKFSARIFEGEMSGSADINLSNLKVQTDMVLKNISIRHLSAYLKQYSIAASGRLSALTRLEFKGLDYNTAINSLQGYIKFNIDNGELSQFAKLERFLQAGNILSQSILKLTLNSIASSISKQNTGDFKTIEGTVKINSPMAEIQYINTQGTNMSLHIEGKYNIINNYTQLKILGRIPVNIVNILGNIGKFSLSQLFDNQSNESLIEKMISDYADESDINKIPPLVIERQNEDTREFVVHINGLLNNSSSVKNFKWLYKN